MFKSLSELGPMVALGGGLTMVAMFWGHIKTFMGYFYSIFVAEVVISPTTKHILYDYLYKQNKISKLFRKREIDAYWLFYKPVNKAVNLPAESGGPFMMFFNGGFPVFVSEFTQESSKRHKVSYIRFTLDFDGLIRDAFDANISLYASETNRVFVQRFIGSSVAKKGDNNEEMTPSAQAEIHYGFNLVGYDKADTFSDIKENGADNYCFSKECNDALEFLRKWKNSKDWYNKKMIPWKVGLCLEGAPGTGKSSFCRVISKELNMPVFVFDIATMSNNEFVDFWKKAQTHCPCICLIEDIDRVFDKDKNITTGDMTKQHLTFDCLLNCLSGVENNEGVMSIITANNSDRIDASLGRVGEHGQNSRPGRIDFILHFDVLDDRCRRIVANKMLEDFPELIEETVALGQNETGAQFTNRCAVLALNKFWESHNG